MLTAALSIADELQGLFGVELMKRVMAQKPQARTKTLGGPARHEAMYGRNP